MRLKCFLLVGALALSGAVLAQRKPTVTFAVSGSSGNYTLDFNVTNNMLPGEGYLYFFGVYLDTGRNIAGSPSNGYWDPNTWTSWNNSGYGGSSLTYNNVWIDVSYPFGTIAEGTSMNGFQALYTGAVAPTVVSWFAFGFGGSYNGNDYFNHAGNPGFEGSSVVPEPATIAALGLGLLAFTRKRKA